MPTVVIHIANEDPIMGEIEKLPAPIDTILHVKNPRRKDGKDVSYLMSGITEAIWPIARMTFIEIMPGDNEEEIIGFVRE